MCGVRSGDRGVGEGSDQGKGVWMRVLAWGKGCKGEITSDVGEGSSQGSAMGSRDHHRGEAQGGSSQGRGIESGERRRCLTFWLLDRAQAWGRGIESGERDRVRGEAAVSHLLALGPRPGVGEGSSQGRGIESGERRRCPTFWLLDRAQAASTSSCRSSPSTSVDSKDADAAAARS